jgi:4-hydroxybenzoate polyprenyltransferase
MTWRAIARLTRLPNLPTAVADVALACLAATAALPHDQQPGFSQAFPAFVLLALASASFYLSGMVFNDYFDADEDRRDRPERPIPSGEVTLTQALRLGVGLLAAGVTFAVFAGITTKVAGLTTLAVWPTVISVLLIGAILAYDGALKVTVVGPLGMGACRMLNVLLGASIVGPPTGLAMHLGLVVGLYVVGLTWFARTEARTSSRMVLTFAAAVMASALLLALPLPLHLPEGQTPSPLFVYLLVGLGFFLGLPAARAVRNPSPSRVQAAVTRFLMGLILLDAVLATATVGTAGVLIALLMAPSVYLNSRRWLYAT